MRIASTLFATVILAACTASPDPADGVTSNATTPAQPESCDDGDDDEDACEVDTSYMPEIDPARFVTDVDNPLFPLVPGACFEYQGPGDERVEITVTHDRKTILGVSTVVVHAVERDGDEVIEDTFDWYAQDIDGAVWYFGEDTRELEDGEVVSTEGSWEAGVDGAQPGILIPAVPEVGMRYRQEYLACEAEDFGEIVSLCEDVTVAGGAFTGCLQTLDTTPLEPDVAEHKFYCPGVGFVLAIDLQTGDREELVDMTP